MAYKYPVDSLDTLGIDDLTTGESTFSRRFISNTTLSAANGIMRLTYFTAKRSETITRVRTMTGAGGQVGATLNRVGIYSVATNGDLTLVASIPNTTSLWLAASTTYVTDLSASFAKVRGQRYAVGNLTVGSSTAAQFSGHGLAGAVASEMGLAPRICGYVGSQTDLPSSVAAGSVVDSLTCFYHVLLPAAA
jgi:hypothetical protein